MSGNVRSRFEQEGFAVLPTLLAQDRIVRYAELVDSLLAFGPRRPAGARRVLSREPRLRAVLDEPPVRSRLEEVGMGSRRVVRSLVFDKSPEANWAVPWHQDPTIAVAERVEAPRFGPWRVSDGVHHWRPPREVLESIVILRIHLDPNTTDNGPLMLVPGSHAEGVLTDEQVDRCAEAGPAVCCTTEAGGAVLMRPLTVHSSPRAATVSRRRTLHLEFSAIELPGGLAWGE